MGFSILLSLYASVKNKFLLSIYHKHTQKMGRKTPTRKSPTRKSPTKQRQSLTRGWSKASPRRGRPRHALMKKCGASCFLMPEHEKFPVCQKLSKRRKQSNCKLDCRGVMAAKMRAAQWKYPEIEERASMLYQKQCND